MNPSTTAFNGAKYKALMDGLEVSEVLYSDLNREFRIDAEYFYKDSLHMQQLISSKKHIRIGDIAFVTDGIHTSIDYDDDSNIHLLSATSPRQNTFDLSRGAFISQKAHKENPRTALKENDVIISTVGTIGNCAVVDSKILPANCDRHVGIIRDCSEIDPYVLSTFLLSKYGRNQTIREATGNVQLNLFLYKIKEIEVPLFGTSFQEKISQTVQKARRLLSDAEDLYEDVEINLEKELQLDAASLSADSISIKSFSESFGQTGRLDAEYYQKKYDNLFDSIENGSYCRLKDIVSISKSIEPGSGAYCDEGIPFIRISDFSKYGFTKPDKYLEPGSSYDIKELYLKKDEILFSKDGSIGIAYKVEQDTQAITSGALLHLRVTADNVLPDYLVAVLNSDVVQLQAERDAGGSIINHWKPSEIEDVLIPVLETEKQQSIVDKIRQSFDLRHKSEKMLFYAVKAVEMAIEKDEATATTWLQSQAAELGV